MFVTSCSAASVMIRGLAPSGGAPFLKNTSTLMKYCDALCVKASTVWHIGALISFQQLLTVDNETSTLKPNEMRQKKVSHTPSKHHLPVAHSHKEPP